MTTPATPAEPLRSAVRYDKDADGIVTLTLDDPKSSANTMNDRYAAAMGEAVDRLEEDVAGGDVAGVVGYQRFREAMERAREDGATSGVKVSAAVSTGADSTARTAD